MWLRPEQLPHFVREARIESFSYFSPVASDSRAMRPGRSALAARRSSSTRAFRSSGGSCGGSAARFRASRSRAASIHSAFSSRNAKARFCDTPRGNDNRTAPVARTLIETRRARTDCESVTSPNRGCTQTEVIASAQH